MTASEFVADYERLDALCRNLTYTSLQKEGWAAAMQQGHPVEWRIVLKNVERRRDAAGYSLSGTITEELPWLSRLWSGAPRWWNVFVDVDDAVSEAVLLQLSPGQQVRITGNAIYYPFGRTSEWDQACFWIAHGELRE